MEIKEIKEVTYYQNALADLFQQVVAAGASMNYLHPMSQETALLYWHSVPAEDVRLFIALLEEKVAGTVQLQLSTKENGQHRAEIAKLMTHPNARRQGVARKLLQHAEQAAREEGRSLLLLDTEKDGIANVLYKLEGYELYGEVPAFAQDAFANFKDGNFYYKVLK